MSVDFTRGYSPPGVYIEEDPAPLVSTTGLPPTRVAIIGQSLGYQTKTEQINLGAVSVRLAQRGITQVSVSATKVADGVVVASSQYTLVVVQGLTVNPLDSYTDLTRSGAATVPEGTPMWVTYKYVEPTYFDPKMFDNFEEIKNAYGAPLNLLPQTLGQSNYQAINSPLTLAAQCALLNGVGEVVLVALDVAANATSAAIKTALAAAYAKISTDYAISVVVPLTDGITTADAPGTALDLRSHVEAASADGFFRTGFIGFEVAVVTAPDALISTGGFASKRVMLAYANSAGLQLFNGNANQTVTVGHQYLAAAYGGLAAALPVQKSLTQEQVVGFSGIAGTPLSNTLKNQYSSAGVALTQTDRRGRTVVRHGTTTNRLNMSTAELSVVRARDAMVSLLQSGTEGSGLIGEPIDINTPLSVKSVVSGVLEYCVSTSTIVAYDNLQVRQASLDPSVIEVKFGYRPAYPLNYILISFSINVSSGDTSLTDQAA